MERDILMTYNKKVGNNRAGNFEWFYTVQELINFINLIGLEEEDIDDIIEIGGYSRIKWDDLF